MTWSDEREPTIIGVIRGDTPFAALADTDLEAFRGGAHPPCHGNATFRVQVGMQDIARGLVAYRTRPEELYDWAWALLSWDFIEIAAIECWRDPASVGGAVLSALWNAAYQLPIDVEIERAVVQVAAGCCPISARIA